MINLFEIFINRFFTKKYYRNPTELKNIPNGEYYYRDEDDESLLIKNYKNNQLHGPSFYFYNTDDIWIRQNYKNGLIHGKTFYYNRDGSLKKKEIWIKGELKSDRRKYS